MQQTKLTEKELMQDILQNEKALFQSYGMLMTEASCQNLRMELQKIMTETQQMQFGIFTAMQEKDWYNVKNAPLTDVSDAITNMQSLQGKLQ